MDYSDTRASMDNPVTPGMEGMSEGKAESLMGLNMCRKCNQSVLHIFRGACGDIRAIK